MKERPILFSELMIRALLEGRKTQTRRVVKSAPSGDGWQPELRDDCTPFFGGPGLCWTRSLHPIGFERCPWLRNPYGAPGDRLWVREAHAIDYECSEGTRGGTSPAVYYRATDADDETQRTRVIWKSSIFMPRWASRITLEITSVRVERLHAIITSDSDCFAEGVAEERDAVGPFFSIPGVPTKHRTTWCPYAKLWESIHGERSWDANPWVWVIGFRRLEGGGTMKDLDKDALFLLDWDGSYLDDAAGVVQAWTGETVSVSADQVLRWYAAGWIERFGICGHLFALSAAGHRVVAAAAGTEVEA